MLIQFTIGNYRSFGEEATLNMVASNKIARKPEHCVSIDGSSGQSALRTAIIYGANAAGKSNLVKAIGLAQRLVSERMRLVEPFASEEFTGKPSTFEFQFLAGNRAFVYGFDILLNRVLSEWLAVIRGDEEITVFERSEDGDAKINENAAAVFAGDPVIEICQRLKDLPTKRDQLFLNRAWSVPEEILGDTLRSIIRWFSRELVVLPPGSRTSDIIDRLATDSAFRGFCSRFLWNVGTGIEDLSLNQSVRNNREWERPWLDSAVKLGRSQAYPWGEDDMDVRPSPSDPNSVIVRRLFAMHPTPASKFSLPFSAQSDGTQTLLHLLPHIATAPNENRVLVLDELDRSLHPKLAWELIRFFSESCPGARKQLIATTHEIHLLNQELLRRDEYWFAEKDDRQQTKLYSLLDFPIRNDLKLEKGYLQGRFGAIPVVGGMQDLENLLECTGEGSNATEETPS